MSFDPDIIRDLIHKHGHIARIVIAETKGSVPREAGVDMFVWGTGQRGTIGGGAFEYEATAKARRLLEAAAPRAAQLSKHALGPDLGQCCGGAVTLVTEVFTTEDITGIESRSPLRFVPLTNTPKAIEPQMPSPARGIHIKDGWLIEPVRAEKPSLWIYGAGHVGEALVHTLAPLEQFQITWVDTAADRFPDMEALGVYKLVAVDPSAAVPHSPSDAHHLILTYSHQMDLALCRALLSHGFASAGLIGSRTKWARFRGRLRQLGHQDAHIDRISCPIGEPALGKHPQAIAVGVAASLLKSVTTQTATVQEAAL